MIDSLSAAGTKHSHMCLLRSDRQRASVEASGFSVKAAEGEKSPASLRRVRCARVETRRGFRLIRQHKVACCYFCAACVSGLLKIDGRDTEHVEGQISQREAVRRGQQPRLLADC